MAKQRIARRASALLILGAVAPFGLSPLSGQDRASDEETLTTVYGAPPMDLSTLANGPEIEGVITGRNNSAIEVTSADGSTTIVSVSPGTDIKSVGGFLGLDKDRLGPEALLNGLPVDVETVRWGRRLLASEIEMKSRDLRTATMIQRGTAQRFAQQDRSIEENRAATEALRGRVADIDQYNIKGTTNVYFDSGKWNLSPRARQDLCTAAAQADAMDNALLLVVGYTDSTGSYELNQQLSEKRAGRVVNHLQQQCGWKPWRMLSPTGMAEADPLADNTTEAGKAQNRRVTVNILVSKSIDGM